MTDWRTPEIGWLLGEPYESRRHLREEAVRQHYHARLRAHAPLFLPKPTTQARLIRAMRPALERLEAQLNQPSPLMALFRPST